MELLQSDFEVKLFLFILALVLVIAIAKIVDAQAYDKMLESKWNERFTDDEQTDNSGFYSFGRDTDGNTASKVQGQDVSRVSGVVDNDANRGVS